MNISVRIHPMERVPGQPDIKAAKDYLAQFPQINIPVTHYFADRAYGREATIPADCIVGGKQHRFRNINVLLSGTVTVATPGQKTETITGPHVFVANPGAERIVRTITEVRWLVVHGTDETDVDKIETEVIEPERPMLAGGGA